ncbi:DUF3021 domain-containing protein [Flavonifractor sp. An112]|uniref:DUF3021 domain-containing protein n=1 Tax=Flavonifractor sp. An112 TaxID=1965544 RepID=UPI00174EA5C4|nr:DUF3021 domain-containing protein [Flavonifractor sp. An112]HIZ94845.1 DUF3021 domain-containing protein [Candidatus Flavonifractor avicola]
MKKELLLRGLLGIPLGIAIGHLITVFSSLFWGTGAFYPCMPAFAAQVGSEAQAVLLQTALCGLVGFGFAAGSVLWELERWSLARQTAVYFLLGAALLIPTAYVCHWMERSAAGILAYLVIFTVIFFLIWIIRYLLALRSVKKLNAALGHGDQSGS